MSSALGRMGTGGSMRKRRARSLAGDDAFTKAESAPDCRCGPAIPTQTCASPMHAGSSTNDGRDHQPPIIAAWRTRPHCLAVSDRSSIRSKSWPGRRVENARLRRQGKSDAIRQGARREIFCPPPGQALTRGDAGLARGALMTWCEHNGAILSVRAGPQSPACREIATELTQGRSRAKPAAGRPGASKTSPRSGRGFPVAGAAAGSSPRRIGHKATSTRAISLLRGRLARLHRSVLHNQVWPHDSQGSMSRGLIRLGKRAGPVRGKSVAVAQSVCRRSSEQGRFGGRGGRI